jgi:hypothetical protein
MALQTKENPAATPSRTGFGNAYRRGADNISDATENRRPAQAEKPRGLSQVDRVKLELIRDLLRETLGFALLYGEVGQALAEVGDDAGTLHALNNFLAAARVAQQCGRDIRALRMEGGR